jgi:hypothetical protein
VADLKEGIMTDKTVGSLNSLILAAHTVIVGSSGLLTCGSCEKSVRLPETNICPKCGRVWCFIATLQMQTLDTFAELKRRLAQLFQMCEYIGSLDIHRWTADGVFEIFHAHPSAVGMPRS